MRQPLEQESGEQAWPCSLAMLSGWNWTPWIGSARMAQALHRAVLGSTHWRSGRRAGCPRRRRANGSASRRSGEGRPAKTPAAVMARSPRPCRASAPARARRGRRNASAIAWWPRQTPSRGIARSAQAATSASEMPASSGVPGPGRDQRSRQGRSPRLGGGQRIVARDPHVGARSRADNGPDSR